MASNDLLGSKVETKNALNIENGDPIPLLFIHREVMQAKRAGTDIKMLVYSVSKRCIHI
jgi:hypothetical protein